MTDAKTVAWVWGSDGSAFSIGWELVCQGNLVTTARTYTHGVADEAELDYGRMLG